MFKILEKVFDSNEKQLNKFRKVVDEVNALEPSVQKLTDDELRAKTESLRKQLAVDLEHARDPRDPFLPPLSKEDAEKAKKDDQEKLLLVLPEAFACVRESARRFVVHRAFDVQVLAANFLARGYVTELFTGEGKSLVATLPLYLYALSGKGAHLVTVNDYLARRDGEWAGHILNGLGMKVGVITPGASYRFIDDEEMVKLKGDEGKEAIEERKKVIAVSGRLLMSSMKGMNLIQCSKKEAYGCDVVYGTNNEFGFDYLRDNMAMSLDQRVQDVLHYAIVDESDSILIDEARTPLIISSPAEDSNEMYRQFAMIAAGLTAVEDYTTDEKAHSVSLTEAGVDKVEKQLNIENIWENYAFVHHINNALSAKELYKRDDHYLVSEGEIKIVDEFTGRVLPGRRYSEGLHQAIEAKEGVEVKRESRTLATITFQNFFRLYTFLAGMTGTALTEAEEFAQIYKLEVVVVPTNKPVIRKDASDVVYRTRKGKFDAVVGEIKKMHEKHRPVLVGTTSVEHSEYLSGLLSKEGIPHEVLNAKHHQKEAMIVAKAGERDMVTISTNMAGRGTDIALGSGVVDLGGLHVIGTERHESRRIDNQLRGRSGRQGDPGSSKFYASFEDNLMRIFGGDSMGSILARVGMDDNMPVEAGIIGKSIESAQKKVEAHNFDTRKHLVEYDDVLNQQREIVYDLRRKILTILKKSDPEETEMKPPDQVKYNWSFVTSDDFAGFVEKTHAVTLKNSETWQVGFPDQVDVLERPLRLWILKTGLSYIDFIIGAQTKDDARVSGVEEQSIISGFLDIVPQELAELAAKRTGYGDWADFVKKLSDMSDPEVQRQELYKLLVVSYILHIFAFGDQAISEVEKILILQTIDNLWIDHLDLMTDLRHGIDLRGYAQKNPLVEYKNEGFMMFDRMLRTMEDNIIKRFFKVRVVKRLPAMNMERAQTVHDAASGPVVPASGSGMRRVPSLPDSRPGNVSKQKTVIKPKKIGRNDPCPCGSGKKYKKCHYPEYG